ncbi:transposable element Tc1 transposase [Trichonephila clavipes]|uniref:Transposable element Tc1 transposase n=1 Tax=Trichonephila clavipes TaxID=2585209 RepID=A0A8X6S769_TRICX|nr:transposable element Tc1 transposase [Trichonephila clavipes]
MIIHIRLIEENLRSYRPLPHLPLTPACCRTRLQWYLARSVWNHTDWGRIVFNDESAPNCVLKIIEDVSRNAQESVSILLLLLSLFTCSQPGIMVWDAISFDNRTPLGVIRAHFLHSNLSKIEHVWDIMRRRLHLQGNIDDLARQLEQFWQEISPETIRVLYHSMSRRVAACIQARGGSTPYFVELVTL